VHAGEADLPVRIEGERNPAPFGLSKYDGDEHHARPLRLREVAGELLSGDDLLRLQFIQDDALKPLAGERPLELHVDVFQAIIARLFLRGGDLRVREIGLRKFRRVGGMENEDVVLAIGSLLRTVALHHVAEKVSGPFAEVLRSGVERRRQKYYGERKRAKRGARAHGQNLAIADSDTTVCREERSMAAWN